MTASTWDKFLLLSWKNWIIQIRHPIQTVFEIIVPIIVCALLIVIRGLVKSVEHENDFLYATFPTDNIGEVLELRGINLQLAYSPKNAILEDLVKNVAQQFEFSSEMHGFHNATELENYASTIKPFASFEFSDNLRVSKKIDAKNCFYTKKFLQDISELPNTIDYAIRFPAELRTNDTTLQRFAGFFYNWATNRKLSDEFSSGPRNKDDDDGGSPPGYIYVRITLLQEKYPL